MFPATITLHTATDLQKVMSVLYPTTGVVEITDKTRGVPVNKTNDADLQSTITKAEAKHNPQVTKAAQDEPAATTADSQPTAEEAKADAPAIDYLKDVKPLVLKMIQAGKRTKAVTLLAEFKVDKADALKPEQWPAFIEKANATLAEA